jgi:hypothetical protein
MRTFPSIVIGVTILCLALTFSVALGAAPQLLNVQGKLTDPGGTPVADGTYSIQFSIYNVASGGTPLWQEIRSVSVSNGLFSVQLGEFTTLPPTLFDNTSLWLGIKVGTDPEMSPRQRLVTAPYAFRVAGVTAAAGWVDDGSVIRLETNSDSVGIGTVTPQARLHVEDSSGTAIRAISQGSTGAAAGVWAESSTWHAVLGINSNSNAAVMGRNDGTGAGIKGQNQSTGPAITGYASTGNLLELYTTPGPNLKLTVNNNGDLQTSGTIESTGGGFKFPDATVQTTAAINPVAMAVVSSGGNIMSGWPSGIAVTWNAASSYYEITIPGENFYYSQYVTTVTPIGGSSLTVSTSSMTNKLIVLIYDSNGNLIQNMFQFIVYKP